MSDEITLIAESNAETGLYVDRRCGFSQAIPGHPQLAPPTLAPGEPDHDALVTVADIGVEVRFHLNDVEPTDKPDLLAQTMTQAYAFNRAGGMAEVLPAWPFQLELWQASGGANAIYTLKEPDGNGFDTEEVLILVGDAQAMIITKRLKSAAINWVQWALFNSATNAAIIWTPDGAERDVPHLWPENSYLEPGISGTLKPEQEAAIEQASAVLAGINLDLEMLAERFSTFILGNEPPWQELTDSMRNTFGYYLFDIVEHDDMRNLIAEALRNTQTMHDLRGFAIMMLRAIDRVHQMPLP